jgi:5-methylcytosine-specific restriction enzyme A
MPKPEITRKSVLKAIADFDKRGEVEFFLHYGFQNAKIYQLIYKGKVYPSKAMYGVAFKFLAPDYEPLLPCDCHGGYPVVKPLQRLGFQIIEKNK